MLEIGSKKPTWVLHTQTSARPNGATQMSIEKKDPKT